MEWLNPAYQALLPWIPLITAIGIAMAVASTLAIPWLLVRIPADYFVSRKRPRPDRSLLGWLIWLLRNTVAVVLLLAGILMLILPGQGLLTILIGVGISTFPGKYRLERAIMRQPGVFRAANWIRRRYHRTPIIHPDDPDYRHQESAHDHD
jgi:Na+/proline symporter